jgi:hypothetical protein
VYNLVFLWQMIYAVRCSKNHYKRLRIFINVVNVLLPCPLLIAAATLHDGTPATPQVPMFAQNQQLAMPDEAARRNHNGAHNAPVPRRRSLDTCARDHHR